MDTWSIREIIPTLSVYAAVVMRGLEYSPDEHYFDLIYP